MLPRVELVIAIVDCCTLPLEHLPATCGTLPKRCHYIHPALRMFFLAYLEEESQFLSGQSFLDWVAKNWTGHAVTTTAAAA
jgi:hypothetical protein